jgi:uracil-DNA glycosylase
VKHDRCLIPEIDIDPASIKMLMISEAAPQDANDYFYAGRDSLFEQTTLLAFQDAGVEAGSIMDLVSMGIYFTTAVKCGKIGYGIKASTIKECSLILGREIALFPNIMVFMLMGDAAIKALNYIAKREGEPRVVPAGSTYKIRGESYHYRGKRAFPSYLQAGPSFFIEKSKRKMIAEDIKAALRLIA